MYLPEPPLLTMGFSSSKALCTIAPWCGEHPLSCCHAMVQRRVCSVLTWTMLCTQLPWNCKPSAVPCSQYRRGNLVLKSDNLSSLAILREFITKEATLQKTRIQLSFKLDAGSISHSVNSLWPRMKQHMQHSRENLLLEALQVSVYILGLHEPVACSERIVSHCDHFALQPWA